ncbi:hypothetical protein [Ornithinibacillus contaminans]|nr:hypothetical protein [Ornithinibacillus contaminans]
MKRFIVCMLFSCVIMFTGFSTTVLASSTDGLISPFNEEHPDPWTKK